MKIRRPRVLALGLAATLLALTACGTAQAEQPREVDQSLLVPTTLDSSFAPFDCKLERTGPVCTGERHIDDEWAPADFPCEVPLWGRREEDRYTTRYYDHDFLNYDRLFRTRDVDYLGPAPQGPATASISTNVRFREPFAVPGDDSTITVVSEGVLWDVRPSRGRPVFRAVGTLVEPPDAGPTFTGRVTIDGEKATYEDAPPDVFFTDDLFVGWVCRVATGA